MRNLDTVLLDVDGTLIDSNDAHARAWLAVFERHGYSTSFARVRELIGKGGDKLLPEVTGLDPESALGKRLSREREREFRENELPNIRAFPRANELLRRFRAEGLKLVVASSAKDSELDALLAICDANALIERRASADDAESSKPDPDIVEAALRKARCAASRALLLGDTPYDVEAATRAGVRCVALRCGGHPESSLRGAVAIYDDAADLLAHFESSAFANRSATH